MAKYKIDWSVEARLDLIDILEFYVIRNKSALYSKKINAKITGIDIDKNSADQAKENIKNSQYLGKIRDRLFYSNNCIFQILH